MTARSPRPIRRDRRVPGSPGQGCCQSPHRGEKRAGCELLRVSHPLNARFIHRAHQLVHDATRRVSRGVSRCVRCLGKGPKRSSDQKHPNHVARRRKEKPAEHRLEGVPTKNRPHYAGMNRSVTVQGIPNEEGSRHRGNEPWKIRWLLFGRTNLPHAKMNRYRRYREYRPARPSRSPHAREWTVFPHSVAQIAPSVHCRPRGSASRSCMILGMPT